MSEKKTNVEHFERTHHGTMAMSLAPGASLSHTRPFPLKQLTELVEWLADPFEWNHTRTADERKAADTILEKMVALGMIGHKTHPLGGNIWVVQDQIFGRTDGIEAPPALSKADKTLQLNDHEIEQLKLIVSAAHSHTQNENAWRGVAMPSYFEANLDRAERRRKIQKAVADFQKKLA